MSVGTVPDWRMVGPPAHSLSSSTLVTFLAGNPDITTHCLPGDHFVHRIPTDIYLVKHNLK